MYKSADCDQQQISFFHFNPSCGMTLDKENEWIKNANRLPWKASFKLAVEEIERENGQTKEK